MEAVTKLFIACLTDVAFCNSETVIKTIIKPNVKLQLCQL